MRDELSGPEEFCDVCEQPIKWVYVPGNGAGYLHMGPTPADHIATPAQRDKE